MTGPLEPSAWRRFGAHPPESPADPGDDDALVTPAADGFADPHGLIVRAGALARVGEPEPVRAGALADLVARLEGGGHRVRLVPRPVTPRRATVAALHREGSGRFWLWRRHPERHPLPLPATTGPLRFAVMALGALRANGAPTRPRD